MIKFLENVVFGLRPVILGALGLATLFGLYFAFNLHMTAGFDKQLPIGHEYVQTFQQYRDQLSAPTASSWCWNPKKEKSGPKIFSKSTRT